MIQLAINRESANDLTITTVDLPPSMGHPEIRVSVSDFQLITEGEDFLRYIVEYLKKHKKRISPKETMSYGYWLVKFEKVESEILEVWECNADGAEFVKGANLALLYWRDQHRICSHYNAQFKAPSLNQLTVTSKGVLEGLPLKAVRYPSPSHMSGWWLITDQYDGNIHSLNNEHTFHITAARPELAKFLALPDGFRFHSDSEKAWFDEEVANSTA